MPATLKNYLVLGLIIALFLLIRLPALHLPYHQDEYKWVLYSHLEIIAPGAVPHPPLTEFIYTRIGPLVGDDNFRAIPLIFSLANLLLVFYLSKIIFDRRTAYGAAFLFAVSFYSVLASVMVDVDGAVMPFFLLLLMIGYYKFREQPKWPWLILLLVGAVGGFLVKVSALLPLAAIALDLAIVQGVFKDRAKSLKYFLGIVLVAVALADLLLASRIFFPFFNLPNALKYWEHFANSSSFLGRGWFQTFIQSAKALLYTSPLLIIPVAFIDREIFKKSRPFFFFIFLGLLFYLILFDFSLGALDRYFEFLIVPLCLIAGAVLTKNFGQRDRPGNKKIFWASAIVTGLIFLLQFVNQAVPPLYPKTEWLNRLFSFHWNFLFPFTGGSGPVPFYLSFAFIGLIWLLTAILALVASKPAWRRSALLGLVIAGLVYNGVFIEEYLFGRINGSAPMLIKNAAAFIAADPAIKKVTVYNDNGGFNILATGKYRKRLYVDPKFDVSQKIATLNQYKEDYLVVDIPRLDSNTVYAKYFSTCQPIYHERSGVINSFIYDCRHAPDLK